MVLLRGRFCEAAARVLVPVFLNSLSLIVGQKSGQGLNKAMSPGNLDGVERDFSISEALDPDVQCIEI